MAEKKKAKMAGGNGQYKNHVKGMPSKKNPRMTTNKHVIEHLEKNPTSPEALAFMQMQVHLIEYYFPNWGHEEKDLIFFRDYIKNTINSKYLEASTEEKQKVAWLKEVNEMGKDSAVDANITIEIV
jgi:hypothetical protein